VEDAWQPSDLLRATFLRRRAAHRGGRALGPRRRRAGRPPRLPGGQHGHRGGPAHLHDDGQPRGRRARRHGPRRARLGGLDRRGEPPRRPAQPVPLPLRPPRHTPGHALIGRVPGARDPRRRLPRQALRRTTCAGVVRKEPETIRRMDEMAQDRAARKEPEYVSFSWWIFDRPVRIG
jgi:hypothetical protein